MKTSLTDFFSVRARWVGLLVVVVLVLSCVGVILFLSIGGGILSSSLNEYPPPPASEAGFLSSGEADYDYGESPASQNVVEREVIVEAEYAPSEPGLGYADDSVAINDLLASAVTQAQAATRVIIYTGNMSLVVKDTQQAIEAITNLANEKGGYVSSSEVYQYGEVLRGSITIRIPAELYQEVLADLRDLAVRVERESSNTQDVTEEFTDLQARKTNLEAAEAALLELLDERKRIGSTSDILEVYRDLTNIRGQIEQIEGRLRFLTNQAALSTITIELIPDVLYQPISVAGWEPQGVAKESLQNLVVALQGLANLTIRFVIFLLPLLIILLIPIVGVVWIIRWWWKRGKAEKQTQVEKVD